MIAHAAIASIMPAPHAKADGAGIELSLETHKVGHLKVGGRPIIRSIPLGFQRGFNRLADAVIVDIVIDFRIAGRGLFGMLPGKRFQAGKIRRFVIIAFNRNGGAAGKQRGRQRQPNQFLHDPYLLSIEVV